MKSKYFGAITRKVIMPLPAKTICGNNVDCWCFFKLRKNAYYQQEAFFQRLHI